MGKIIVLIIFWASSLAFASDKGSSAIVKKDCQPNYAKTYRVVTQICLNWTENNAPVGLALFLNISIGDQEKAYILSDPSFGAYESEQKLPTLIYRILKVTPQFASYGTITLVFSNYDDLESNKVLFVEGISPEGYTFSTKLPSHTGLSNLF